MSRSTDYHDYVFKNGKFIGKFESMYKNSRSIPWHQNDTAHAVFSDIDIAILSQYRYDTICDVGCGLGYFTNRLRRELRNGRFKVPTVTGIDISRTAVKEARKMFSGIQFIMGDLLKERPLRGEYFDLIVAKEILWYICPRGLDVFLKNFMSMIKKQGFFYISQSFPESRTWVGKKIIGSPSMLRKLLSEYGRPIYYCVEHDWNLHGRPLVHFLGKCQKM